MKTLQSNFTTPEQSKRLLDLGVPADSADCYYNTFAKKPYVLYDSYSKTIFLQSQPPCWSVGRLIEISRICSTLPEEEYMFPFWYDTQDNIEWAIRVIESGIITGNMDFSKLEEQK